MQIGLQAPWGHSRAATETLRPTLHAGEFRVRVALRFEVQDCYQPSNLILRSARSARGVCSLQGTLRSRMIPEKLQSGG